MQLLQHLMLMLVKVTSLAHIHSFLLQQVLSLSPTQELRLVIVSYPSHVITMVMVILLLSLILEIQLILLLQQQVHHTIHQLVFLRLLLIVLMDSRMETLLSLTITH